MGSEKVAGKVCYYGGTRGTCSAPWCVACSAPKPEPLPEPAPAAPTEPAPAPAPEAMRLTREDLANAFVVCASLHPKSAFAERVKRAVRVQGLSSFSVAYTYARHEKWEMLDGFEDGAREAYFRLIGRLKSAVEEAELREGYRRIHAQDGVEIVVENCDDDPTRINFHICDPLASAWADRNGALMGGTWESVDGEDFVHDSGSWYEGCFEEKEMEGYDFNFSAYSEPDARDLRIMKHASECDACDWDFRKAEKHLGPKADEDEDEGDEHESEVTP